MFFLFEANFSVILRGGGFLRLFQALVLLVQLNRLDASIPFIDDNGNTLVAVVLDLVPVQYEIGEQTDYPQKNYYNKEKRPIHPGLSPLKVAWVLIDLNPGVRTPPGDNDSWGVPSADGRDAPFPLLY
jgi:hypothetical protein